MDVSAETKYKRFLHYASEDGIYIPGCRFHFKNYSPERLTSLDTLVSEGKEDFVIDTILKIHNDKTSAYPEALVFALVQCIRNKNYPKLVERAYKLFDKICSTVDLLFLFFKFSYEIKPRCGTGRAFRRVVRNWYLSKTALDLADIVTWRPKYKGWRHADTIKLAHVTSSDPAQGAVLRYVSRGLKDTLEKYGGIPEAEEVLKHLSEVDAFRKETDPASVTRTIDCYMLTVDHLNHILLKNKEVWTALIRLMPISVILDRFQFLSKKGMFRKDRAWDSDFIYIIMDALQNPASIESSGLHPSRVYIELCTYKNAARMKLELESKTGITREPPTICGELLKSLEKVFRSTFKLLKPTGKSFVVAVDFGSKMPNRRCSHCPYMKCSDAANLITLCLLKAEKCVDILAFSGIDPILKQINIPTDASVEDVFSALRENKLPWLSEDKERWNFHMNKTGMIQVGTQAVQVNVKSLFNWAVTNKKMADVFIILSLHVRVLSSIQDEFKKYKESVGVPNTRLVICNLSGPRMKQTINGTPVKPDVIESEDIFTISGFNDKFFKVLDAFSKGAF